MGTIQRGLGAAAAELLLERMRAERREAQARVVTVRPDLVVRGSTAARRVGDGA
jgi:DNA-binding LacI/PurR family transcriptional regulator